MRGEETFFSRSQSKRWPFPHDLSGTGQSEHATKPFLHHTENTQISPSGALCGAHKLITLKASPCPTTTALEPRSCATRPDTRMKRNQASEKGGHSSVHQIPLHPTKCQRLSSSLEHFTACLITLLGFPSDFCSNMVAPFRCGTI